MIGICRTLIFVRGILATRVCILLSRCASRFAVQITGVRVASMEARDISSGEIGLLFGSRPQEMFLRNSDTGSWYR